MGTNDAAAKPLLVRLGDDLEILQARVKGLTVRLGEAIDRTTGPRPQEATGGVKESGQVLPVLPHINRIGQVVDLLSRSVDTFESEVNRLAEIA